MIGGKGEGRGDAGSEWMRENNELLTNPAIVALLRSIVMGSDDFLAGWLRVPPEISHLLGDEGLGVVGLHTSAGLLAVLAGRGGLLTETEVRVAPTGSNGVPSAPHGFGDRIARVPDPALRDDGAQVVVERYSTQGGDRFEVYIAGTVSFALEATTEPWDMTSNVSGVAGQEPGSYAAVAEALVQAGVTADSPIVFNGYSQGGLVAAMLASSGDYNTRGLVTVGAPAGQVQLPEGFPVVAIEHTDDIVPAVGGSQVNPGVIVVERELFGGRSIPTEFAVPAHQLEEYRKTARLLDDVDAGRVAEAIESLNSFADGATAIASTTYRSVRIQD
jgi:pimeloyl-ACP methyl ester carboxylesterase